MDTLIAEDLLLLLLEDESGKLRHTTYLDAGIGGALLVELATTGQVDVRRGSGFWSRATVVPVPGAPAVTDPVLADALAVIGEKARPAQDLVTRLGKRRREPLLQRLAERGVLRREDDAVLGLFPRTRWPVVDRHHEDDVRRALADALVRGIDPAPRTSALVSLLSALDLAAKVVDHEGLSSGQVRKRARAIAEGDWAAKGVKDAVAAAQAAVAAAVMVSTTAATSSG
ncbi:MAG: hypothetical protein JWR42_2512 [Marmoricola sp.]|nr:hypothetical protein [Marmoricola sp.]